VETAAKELWERLQDALGNTYTLERELAGGGMSRVFVAREAALGRHVVVKVLPPDAGSLLSAERFKREIALVARLQHPHIVPVLAAGVTADGLPFYTMPLVEGESLRVQLDRDGELAVSDAVSVLKDIARALAYAHARGVVHRDIKPGNVLLSGGAAVVTDFGVAKAVDASATSGGTTSLTQLGVALGTPAYMAPEQAAAAPDVDHRADLYAFGCLAYELLTGSPPFAGRPAPAVLAAQVNEVPEAIRRRRPTVPDALAALVMRCLEKRPADRPASAEEVLRALDVAGIPNPVAGGVPARASVITAERTSSTRGWLIPMATLLLGAGLASLVAWLAWRRDSSGGAEAPRRACRTAARCRRAGVGRRLLVIRALP
jgi:serine/threonine-protein kinase